MKINESGRSMIEMLGVLAIIGVLSVGGIAGYSKAMAKHKINKTVDQITQITASTRALFTGHKNYIALGVNDDAKLKKLIKRARLVPDEMLELKADGVTIEKILNPYTGDVTFAVADKSKSGDNKAFKLTYTMIPMSACIDLATQDWGNRSTSGLVELRVNSDDYKKNRSFTVSEAIKACTEKTTNSISWTFY